MPLGAVTTILELTIPPAIRRFLKYSHISRGISPYFNENPLEDFGRLVMHVVTCNFTFNFFLFFHMPGTVLFHVSLKNDAHLYYSSVRLSIVLFKISDP